MVVALAVPAPAAAAWSHAGTFAARNQGGGQVAVNGRGDVAVMWQSRRPARLRVTLLPFRGRAVTRVIAARPGGYGTIALDERGGATAAWTDGTRLYAAHGSVTVHWSAPRLIARNAFGPVLAVSRQRRVLLAWTNLSKYGPGSTGVAWRTPGTAFSKPVTLTRPAPTLMPGEAPQSDVGATFDAAGRAYLWGTCDGVVRVAASGSRKLGLVSVVPGRALGFSFSIARDGHGLASWVDSRCTSDAAAGAEPGPLRVRMFSAGAFAPSVTLGTGSSSTQAIALAGVGSLVSGWAFTDRMLWSFDAQGALQSTQAITETNLPLAADAGGDLLVTAPAGGLTVHTSDGRADALGHGGTAAAASSGRGFAVVRDPDVTFGADHRAHSPRVRLSVSLWR
jgi:hypothetical protein